MYPTFQALRSEFSQQLSAQYDDREIAQLFFESVNWICGWTKVELTLNANQHASESQIEKFNFLLSRFKEGVPFQYITKRAWFFDRWFMVDENVLIPRPETEELVRWILDSHPQNDLTVIDIGTGSGIIPISLKAHRYDWKVSGLDISSEAIGIALKNEEAHLKVGDIKWILDNILEPQIQYKSPFGIIVSNPPYVLKSEIPAMNHRVVHHEPHLALFVEDDDPLLFYRKIVELSKKHLKSNGHLYFEIHENLAEEMQLLMKKEGFQNVQLKRDFQNKNRMIRGEKP